MLEWAAVAAVGSNSKQAGGRMSVVGRMKVEGRMKVVGKMLEALAY